MVKLSDFDKNQMSLFIETFNNVDLNMKVEEHFYQSKMNKNDLIDHYSNILNHLTENFDNMPEQNHDIVIAYCSKLKIVIDILSKI